MRAYWREFLSGFRRKQSRQFVVKLSSLERASPEMHAGSAPRAGVRLGLAILLAGALMAAGFRTPGPLAIRRPAACAIGQGVGAHPARFARRSVAARLAASADAGEDSEEAGEQQTIPAPGDAELEGAACAMADGRLREALRLVKLARELYAGAGVTDRNDMVDAVQERVQRDLAAAATPPHVLVGSPAHRLATSVAKQEGDQLLVDASAALGRREFAEARALAEAARESFELAGPAVARDREPVVGNLLQYVAVEAERAERARRAAEREARDKEEEQRLQERLAAALAGVPPPAPAPAASAPAPALDDDAAWEMEAEDAAELAALLGADAAPPASAPQEPLLKPLEPLRARAPDRCFLVGAPPPARLPAGGRRGGDRERGGGVGGGGVSDEYRVRDTACPISTTRGRDAGAAAEGGAAAGGA